MCVATQLWCLGNLTRMTVALHTCFFPPRVQSNRLSNAVRPSPWCVSNDSVIVVMKVWHFRVISMWKQLYVMARGDNSHKHIINATKQTAGSAPSQQQGPPCVFSVKDTLTKMDTPALRWELTGRSPTVQDGHFTHKNELSLSVSVSVRHRNTTSLWRKKNKTSLGCVPRCNAGVRHFHASHRAQDNGNNYLKFDVLRSSASRQRWKPAINRKAKKREQVESTISVTRGRNGRSLPYTGRWVAHN